MKKWLALAATAVLGASLLISGCGSSTNDASSSSAGSSKAEVLKVAANPVPHAEILNQIKPLLAKEGVDLQIIEFTDYIQPNMALSSHEVDANTNFVSFAPVHIEPLAIYSQKIKDLKDLPNGAKVAIPSDPTNSARALLLLQSAGLVTLKDPTGLTNTPFDVTSNPKNIQITELEAAQIPRSIQDLDAAVINANYALPAGLNPTKDGLFVEKADSPYANLLSVNPGDENKPAIQKLAKALQSPEVKKFIEDHYKGAIIPAF
ncbi:MAG: MetQ/NlpA family ABC transporter substrate-binding protein [Veillonella sp.]|nr:MetQ/NlpA family ABC transporter substrate-binding protein [Veillonella sp.]